MFKVNLRVRDLYDRVFLILFAVDVVLRTIWLDQPTDWLFFDEHFYVNAARVILGYGGVKGLPVVYGLDPTPYHPPLAKLLIAFSMYIIGDNGFGWRLPSALFGSVAVLLFYLLLKKVADRKIALVGAFLFSFDTLIFGLSRIAMLDIFTLTFMLLGFYLYFSGRAHLSAVSVALSTLTKFPGASGVAVVVMVEAAQFLQNRSGSRSWRTFVGWTSKYVAIYAASFLLILAVLDYFWVGLGNFFRPFVFAQHSVGPHLVSCPIGIISCPWQWLINQIPIYFTIFSFTLTLAMNPAIIFLAVPAMIYSAYQYIHGKSLFGFFNVVWFLVTYLPYYPAAIISHTPTYIFYFVLAMPSVCAAVAYALADKHVPRPLIFVYLIVVLYFFISTFPFQATPF